MYKNIAYYSKVFILVNMKISKNSFKAQFLFLTIQFIVFNPEGGLAKSPLMPQPPRVPGLAPGHAGAYAITNDKKGNLYAGGFGSEKQTPNWLIRKSADHGQTWVTTDEFTYAPLQRAWAMSLAIDPLGIIYAVGGAVDENKIPTWIVRKSSDEGASWKTVHTYQYAPGKDAQAWAISIDKKGNIYVAGRGQDDSGWLTHWLVQKSTDGGQTWELISDFNFVKGKYAGAQAIHIDQGGTIYVGGYGWEGFTDFDDVHWIVRKSSDDGLTWKTIRAVSYGGGKSESPLGCSRCNDAEVKAIATDSKGTVFVAGIGVDVHGFVHWLVQRSSDGGVFWSTVSDQKYELGRGGSTMETTAITVDHLDNIYVAGFGYNYKAGGKWVVSKSEDSGANWKTVQKFNFDNANWTLGYGVTTDANGSIFVAGFGLDYTGFSHWLVQKSTDGGSSWNTVDNFIK